MFPLYLYMPGGSPGQWESLPHPKCFFLLPFIFILLQFFFPANFLSTAKRFSSANNNTKYPFFPLFLKFYSDIKGLFLLSSLSAYPLCLVVQKSLTILSLILLIQRPCSKITGFSLYVMILHCLVDVSAFIVPL